MQHKNRKAIGTFSQTVKGLKLVDAHLRKLQAGIKSLSVHVNTEAAPDLAPMAQWVEDNLVIFQTFAAAEKTGHAGLSDYFRDMLIDWLLVEWVNTLGGDLSFSRDEFENPYGPLITFLSATLTAILGRAPGPSGIAKIIDRYR